MSPEIFLKDKNMGTCLSFFESLLAIFACFLPSGVDGWFLEAFIAMMNFCAKAMNSITSGAINSIAKTCKSIKI